MSLHVKHALLHALIWYKKYFFLNDLEDFFLFCFPRMYINYLIVGITEALNNLTK
jgi:hypothetical protein